MRAPRPPRVRPVLLQRFNVRPPSCQQPRKQHVEKGATELDTTSTHTKRPEQANAKGQNTGGTQAGMVARTGSFRGTAVGFNKQLCSYNFGDVLEASELYTLKTVHLNFTGAETLVTFKTVAKSGAKEPKPLRH